MGKSNLHSIRIPVNHPVETGSGETKEPRSSGEQGIQSSGMADQASRTGNEPTEAESSSDVEDHNEQEGYIKDDVPF